MARHASFDRDTVIRNAMKSFWRDGYSATSMKTLEAATGLTTGSLYNSFEGKEQLFALSLNYYVDNIIVDRIRRHLEATDARAGFEAYCDELLIALENTKYRGCFLLNAHYEAERYSPLVQDIIRRGQQRLDLAVERVVTRMAEQGQIRKTTDAAKLARQLSYILSGVMARSRLDTARQFRNDAMLAVTSLLDR